MTRDRAIPHARNNIRRPYRAETGPHRYSPGHGAVHPVIHIKASKRPDEGRRQDVIGGCRLGPARHPPRRLSGG
ncbi:hypothetical protein GCM10009780_30610 [Actinomadura alba]